MRAIVILFTLVLCLCATSMANAQKKVVMDSKGNYTVVNKAADKTADVETGSYFIDAKGNKYPIRKSINNKLYYLKTSKSGNIYKVYITVTK